MGVPHAAGLFVQRTFHRHRLPRLGRTIRVSRTGFGDVDGFEFETDSAADFYLPGVRHGGMQ